MLAGFPAWGGRGSCSNLGARGATVSSGGTRGRSWSGSAGVCAWTLDHEFVAIAKASTHPSRHIQTSWYPSYSGVAAPSSRLVTCEACSAADDFGSPDQSGPTKL